MLSSDKSLENTTGTTENVSPKTPLTQTAEPSIDLLELELSLDVFTAGESGFGPTMRQSARKLGGEFLFELPASGLADDCSRIAVLRIPTDDKTSVRTIFACLSQDATSIRIEEPSEATEGLKNFADAFVDVLQRI